MSQNFNWNVKRNVQTVTPNKIIQTTALSPKEVIQAKGNRVGMENILDSMMVVLNELMALEEERADRITKMYEGMKDGRKPESTTGV